MKMTEAKNLINDQVSALNGFKTIMNPSNHLILGVKIGALTPLQAAKTCLKEYTEVCNSAFQGAK
jgi:hypothetical protein